MSGMEGGRGDGMSLSRGRGWGGGGGCHCWSGGEGEVVGRSGMVDVAGGSGGSGYLAALVGGGEWVSCCLVYWHGPAVDYRGNEVDLSLPVLRPRYPIHRKIREEGEEE